MKIDGKNIKQLGMSKSELRERLYRRRYVLPNAVTVGNMFGGFLAIIYACAGRFDHAVIAIIVAIVLDGMDGRVARRFNATSKFGLEFDSLSDLVSFGVAPAILMYEWCFRNFADQFGVVPCFFYCVCVASRLARFNVTETNLKAFEGLPSPGGAGMVAATVWLINGYRGNGPFELWELAIYTAVLVVVGYLMVCRLEFRSIKQVKMRTMPIFAKCLLGLLFALIWWKPRVGGFVLALFYCLTGPVLTAISSCQIKARKKNHPTAE